MTILVVASLEAFSIEENFIYRRTKAAMFNVLQGHECGAPVTQ